jgi:hypothetical protein
MPSVNRSSGSDDGAEFSAEGEDASLLASSKSFMPLVSVNFCSAVIVLTSMSL